MKFDNLLEYLRFSCWYHSLVSTIWSSIRLRWLTRCFWYRSCGSQSEQVRLVVPNNGDQDCSCLISILKPVICEQLTPNSKSSKFSTNNSRIIYNFGRNCSLKTITSFDLKSLQETILYNFWKHYLLDGRYL